MSDFRSPLLDHIPETVGTRPPDYNKVFPVVRNPLFERAQMEAKRRAEEVERRILAGENHFTVAAPPGSHVGVYVYNVPAWRREPIKRLRVEWARWKARRG
jgi:hypothetical protein